MDMVDSVPNITLGSNDVRVPQDVVRMRGRSPEWSAFDVSASCVTMLSGLLHALGWSIEVVNRSGCPTPICADDNIHYRLLKICDGENTHRSDVCSRMI